MKIEDYATRRTPLPRNHDPELLADARKGWIFPGVAMGIALVGKSLIASMDVFPVILISFVIFAPVILFVLGFIHTLGAWKRTKTHAGHLAHAVAGTLSCGGAVVVIVSLVVR